MFPSLCISLLFGSWVEIKMEIESRRHCIDIYNDNCCPLVPCFCLFYHIDSAKRSHQFLRQGRLWSTATPRFYRSNPFMIFCNSLHHFSTSKHLLLALVTSVHLRNNARAKSIKMCKTKKYAFQRDNFTFSMDLSLFNVSSWESCLDII